MAEENDGYIGNKNPVGSKSSTVGASPGQTGDWNKGQQFTGDGALTFEENIENLLAMYSNVPSHELIATLERCTVALKEAARLPESAPA